MKFFDLARMTVASTGTGNITLGTAVTGLLTFDLAGCSTTSSGQVIRYAINDNTNSEIGQATYISSSLLLSGRAPEASTNGGSAIGVSNAAQVFITPSAADWQTYTGVVVWSSAMALTSSEAAQASNNISAVSYSSQATALSTTQQAQARSNLGLGWTPIATVDFSTPVAAVDVVLPAGIKFISFSGWVDCGTTQGLALRTSVDGGATFAAGGTDYSFSTYLNSNATMVAGGFTNSAALFLSTPQGIATVPVSVFGTLTTGSTSYLPWLNCMFFADDVSVPAYGHIVGGRAVAAAVNAIRLLGGAGANLNAGRVVVEGA